MFKEPQMSEATITNGQVTYSVFSYIYNIGPSRYNPLMTLQVLQEY